MRECVHLPAVCYNACQDGRLSARDKGEFGILVDPDEGAVGPPNAGDEMDVVTQRFG